MDNKKYLFFVPVMALCAISCQRMEDAFGKLHQEVIITASLDEPDTKTTLVDETKVYWNASDEISVFSAGETAKFTSQNTEPVKTAQFKGAISVVTGSNEEPGVNDYIYGLYPYDASATYNNGIITTTLPSTQTAVAGTFADDLLITLGRSLTYSMPFYNACSGLWITLAEEGITSVTLTATGGEKIAGTFSAGIGADSKPYVDNASGGEPSITLTAPDGGTLQTGTKYYIVTLPVTFSQGITLTFKRNDGYKGVRTIASSFELPRATFRNLPNADSHVDWAKQFPEGNAFDEDAYITYVANHEMWFLGGNQYIYDTYFSGATGTRFEMKFQIPSYTAKSEVTLASESGERYNDTFKVTRDRLFYRTETKNDQEDTDLSSNTIDGTSVIVLSASCNGSQVTATVNGDGKTASLSLSSFDLGYLFSSYYHDNDEGSYTAYIAGVPDGAKLYYVKIWNGDELVHFGHAASASCPYSSNIEYCWYEEISQTYTFARQLTMPSNADPGYGNSSNATVRQPFGGGVDGNLIPVTNISLSQTNLNLAAVGATAQLTATVSPADATFKSVTWSSSNPDVANVSPNGTVTAVADGAAIITATANDRSGVKAECKLTVGQNIVFADATVKSICVANWDKNDDGELSYAEAAEVTTIGTVFHSNTNISSFDELRFFTGIRKDLSNAFYGCSGLTSITIPDGITKIGDHAFEGCSRLVSINIPASVTNIGLLALYGCSALTRIDITDFEAWYNISFSGGSFPTRGHLYLNGTELKDVSIPSSVEVIKPSTFQGFSGFTSLTIPEGVTRIGDYAFYGCSGLTFIKVLSSNVPTGGNYMFNGTTCNIYVPDDSLSQYKEAEYWKDYASRIVGLSTFPG